MNSNLSTGLPYETYTLEQATDVCIDLIHEIAAVTPDRLVLYELQTMELTDSVAAKAAVEGVCDNARLTLNYSDIPLYMQT